MSTTPNFTTPDPATQPSLITRRITLVTAQAVQSAVITVSYSPDWRYAEVSDGDQMFLTAWTPQAIDAAARELVEQAALLSDLTVPAPPEPPPAPAPVATPRRTCTERAQQHMVGATGLQNPRDAWAALAMERGIMVRTISRLQASPTAAPAGK